MKGNIHWPSKYVRKVVCCSLKRSSKREKKLDSVKTAEFCGYWNVEKSLISLLTPIWLKEEEKHYGSSPPTARSQALDNDLKSTGFTASNSLLCSVQVYSASLRLSVPRIESWLKIFLSYFVENLHRWSPWKINRNVLLSKKKLNKNISRSIGRTFLKAVQIFSVSNTNVFSVYLFSLSQLRRQKKLCMVLLSRRTSVKTETPFK